MKQMRRSLSQALLHVPIRQRGTAIIAIPVMCLFTSLATFAWLKANLVEAEGWVQETQQVRLETKRLLNALIDAETGMRGYGLTQREEFLEPYSAALSRIPLILNNLEQLVQDNPQQASRLEEIQALVEESLALMDQKVTLQKELQEIRGQEELVVPTELLYDWLAEGKEVMDETRTQIAIFTEAEEALLDARQQNQEFYRQVTWIVLWGSVLIGTTVSGLAIYLFWQLEKELAKRQFRLEQANQQLAEREQSLRQSNLKLEQAFDQLQRFTANASHELRAPLAAVLSNAQVGLMAPPEDAIAPRQRLEKIVELTKSMSTMVGGLLFLARQEGAISGGSCQPIDLTQWLPKVLLEWHPQAQQQHLTLQGEFPSEAVIVQADQDLLRQAIANLLSNACRYTNPNGTIWLRLTDQEKTAVIEVEDTGIGMEETDLAHIFERFYRADKSRSKAKGGFGLGLAIVQQIVQFHQGTISVKSAIGEGSTFRIELPKYSKG